MTTPTTPTFPDPPELPLEDKYGQPLEPTAFVRIHKGFWQGCVAQIDGIVWINNGQQMWQVTTPQGHRVAVGGMSIQRISQERYEQLRDTLPRRRYLLKRASFHLGDKGAAW